jgi:predicted nuclease of predicted toxin-antitoxin system
VRLLANENIPLEAVRRLQAKGFDVASATDTPGGPDLNVIDRAGREGRILLTFDKDFGQLAVRQHRPVPGVVLLRIPPLSPDYIAAQLLRVLGGEFQLEDRFTVVTANRVRSRPLPKPGRMV